MNIAVVGTGYVGLSTAVSLAHLGNKVICVAENEQIANELRNTEIRVNEQALPEMLARSVKRGTLSFTDNLKEALCGAELLINAIVTAPKAGDGSADNGKIKELATRVGEILNTDLLYVSTTTVPIGTTLQVKTIIENQLRKRGVCVEIEVASLPEFLREGRAIESFLAPSRIVVGCQSLQTYNKIVTLLQPTINADTNIIKATIEEAELIKLALNMLTATRISYINTIAQICDKTEADYKVVHSAIFGKTIPMYAGVGYSGACFPKDIRTLISSASALGCDTTMLQGVETFNQNQKLILYSKLQQYYSHDLSGRKIAIWGVTTKPGSEDIENTAAEEIVKQLLQQNCKVSIYDSKASTIFANKFRSDEITLHSNIYDSAEGAEALFVLTDSAEHKNPDWDKIKRRMATPLVLDAKNIYDKQQLQKQGIIIEGII